MTVVFGGEAVWNTLCVYSSFNVPRRKRGGGKVEVRNGVSGQAPCGLDDAQRLRVFVYSFTGSDVFICFVVFFT